MKKIFIAAACIIFPAMGLNAQYGTNWMNQVKSWEVSVTVKYKDSANPGNFTVIEFAASGTITNELLPAGGRMSWPLTSDPGKMKQLSAKGTFTKRVTDDMPEPNKVEAFTCSGGINENILGSLATTFNNKYLINVRMPEVPGIKCSGLGAPATADALNSLYRDSGIEPTDPDVLMGDCGANKHTLSGSKNYKTATGAFVSISWVYKPVGTN